MFMNFHLSWTIVRPTWHLVAFEPLHTVPKLSGEDALLEDTLVVFIMMTSEYLFKTIPHKIFFQKVWVRYTVLNSFHSCAVTKTHCEIFFFYDVVKEMGVCCSDIYEDVVKGFMWQCQVEVQGLACPKIKVLVLF